MRSSIEDIFKKDPLLKAITLFCIERIILLRDQIQLIADNASQKESAAIKITHFTQCLKQIFGALIYAIESHRLTWDDSNISESLADIEKILEVIVKLHDELSILPKKDEPIELYRFLRIFNKYGIANHDQQKKATPGKDDADINEGRVKFVLYSVQDRGASTYANTPLERYETDTLKPLLERIYDAAPSNVPQESVEAYHIGIRREETRAPLFWPVLAHEVGHQVMELAHFQKRKIEQSFSNYLGGKGARKYHKSFLNLLKPILARTQHLNPRPKKEEILRNWLTECWCDIYAYFATGPAFIFAQRNTFILSPNRSGDAGDVSHPPLYLRLLLLQEINANYQEKLDEASSINVDPLGSSLLSLLSINNESLEDDIFNVSQWFIDFFNDHFKMLEDDASELHEHIRELKRNSTIFTKEILQKLVDRLDAGYPVPSLPDPSDKDKLREKETSVHEIMLAGWISHETSLSDEVTHSLAEGFEKYRQGNINDNWNVFTQEIAPIYERFNQAVLRSLQISEWVSLLKPDGKEYRKKDRGRPDSTFPCDKCLVCDTSLLVDHEIEALLKNDQLKVIPLIDVDTQLGSTSLDVRLGPTFQTYQPNQSGVVDFTDDESVKNVRANSSIVDLDFKEGIVIAPGQFVLAHTMEYIGLPENVAAQIEGRSSFARIGIQVHMTANLIDPGFHGSVTFEIFNAGPNPIRLFPGYRIGQLRFFQCKKPEKPYNRKKNAKYKGLLIYSDSLLAGDYEIRRLKASKKDCKKTM